MFENFGRTPFSTFKLNEPQTVVSGEDVNLAGGGNFHNRNVQLVWSGISERNGEPCALIDYRAYFNPFEIASPGFKMTGRSNYWGQIWISEATREIEYATLYEDVLGEVAAGQNPPQVVNVFRSGTYEFMPGRGEKVQ